MQLQYTHPVDGKGHVIVTAPELPVFITLGDYIEHRSVNILADRGLAASARPTGPRRANLDIEVGRPGPLTMLKNAVLPRQGSFISGGGSVVSSGGNSVAAGGNITGCAIGAGSRVSTSKNPKPILSVGVHILAPEGSTFNIRGARSVTVLIDGKEAVLDPLQFLVGSWSAHVYREQIVVER